jgi:L-arabinose transport system permease protein
MSSVSSPASSPAKLDYGTQPSAWSTFWRFWSSSGMLVVLLALFAGVAIFVPKFLSWVNLKGLLLAVSTVGMISCTMLFCLAAGDFDLSVGSVVAMSGVIAAIVINNSGSVFVGVAVGVVAGGIVGLFNGYIIAALQINALITTLITMQIARGLTYIISHYKSIGVNNPGFFTLGISSPLGVPMPIWLMLAFFLLFGLLLQRTIFGRNTLAIGGNIEAARLAGIRVIRTKVIIFTLQGLVAGFAGVVLASRLTSGQPNNGVGLELQVISACVLGGVSLSGGIGSMLGVIVGVLIMGIVQNAMNLKNIPSEYQLVVSGSILLAAVLIDRFQQRGLR